MSYTFQVYFRLPHKNLSATTNEYVIPLPADFAGERLSLWSADKERPLNESKFLILEGSGYASEAEARSRGERWMAVAKRVMAARHLGADFMGREPLGYTFQHHLDSAEEVTGRRAESLQRGVMTFPTGDEPVYVNIGGSGVVIRDVEELGQAFGALGDRDVGMGPQADLAYELYASAFHERTPEASLFMLTSSLEALVSSEPRSQAALSLLDDLLNTTKARNDVSQPERDGISHALRELRRTSIRQSCLRYINGANLGLVLSQRPPDIFKHAYDKRSALIHGALPQPNRAEINDCVSGMYHLVGDLLAKAD